MAKSASPLDDDFEQLARHVDQAARFLPINKRARFWNSAELFVLVLVLSEAVLAIEKDGKSRAN